MQVLEVLHRHAVLDTKACKEDLSVLLVVLVLGAVAVAAGVMRTTLTRWVV